MPSPSEDDDRSNLSLGGVWMRTTLFVGAVVLSFVAGRIAARNINAKQLLQEQNHLNEFQNQPLAPTILIENALRLSTATTSAAIEPNQQQQQQQHVSTRSSTRAAAAAAAASAASCSLSEEEAEQSDKLGEAQDRRLRAEMLVQPVMLAHPNPKVVAIYMSQDLLLDEDSSSTLLIDQILQHSSTVKTIKVYTSTSTSTGGESHGNSNPNASTITTTHRNGIRIDFVTNMDLSNNGDDTSSETREEVFDVAILNLVDDMNGAGVHSKEQAVQFFSSRLDREGGLLVTTLPTSSNGATTHHHDRVHYIQTNLADGSGSSFAKVTDYPVGDLFFFAVAFKSMSAFAHWHLNPAEYQLRLLQRQVGDGATFSFFDGVTMSTLAYPSKQSSQAFCQMEYGIDQCSTIQVQEFGLNPSRSNIPWSELEVRQSTLGELAGRGVYTTVDAPSGTYFELASSSSPVRVPWTTTELVFSVIMSNTLFDQTGYALDYYFDGYGFYDEPFGRFSLTVDSGLLTFVNHGCNSTYNIANPLSQNELELNLSLPPPSDFFDDKRRVSVYHPLYDRSIPFDETIAHAHKDIRAGEELFDNYLSFGGESQFAQQVMALREQCGGVPGEVERFQRTSSS